MLSKMSSAPSTRQKMRKLQRGQSLVEFSLSITFLVLMLCGVVDLGRAFFTKVILESMISEGAHWAAAYPGCVQYGTAFNPTGAVNIPSACQGTNSIIGRMLKENTNLQPSRIINPSLIPPTGKRLDEIVPGDTVILRVTYRLEMITPLIQGLFGPSFDISSEVKEVVRGVGIPDAPGQPLPNNSSTAPVPPVENLKQEPNACTNGSATLSWSPVPASGYRIYKVNGTTLTLVADIPFSSLASTVTSLQVVAPIITGGSQLFSIRAYNQVGTNKQDGPEVQILASCAKVQPIIPTTPQPTSGWSCSTNGATIAWSMPTPVDLAVASFGIYRDDGSNTYTAMSLVGSTDPSSTNSAFTFGSPSDGTASYVVGARDGSGNLLGLVSNSVPIDCVYASDLTVTLTPSMTGYVAGFPISYTIVVTNNGPDTLTGATVFDSFPVSLTGISWTCVASGGSSCPSSGTGDINTTVILLNAGTATFTVTGTVAVGTTGPLTNTVTGTVPPSTTDTTVPNTATVTLNPGAATSADLAASFAPVGGYTPNTNITYTLTITNNGINLNGATVTDTLPAGVDPVSWSCVAVNGSCTVASGSGAVTNAVYDIQNGGTVTYTIVGHVQPSVTGNITNSATVSIPGGVADPDLSNNTASVISGNVADVAVTITDGQTSYIPGTTVSYTIVISNAGPNPANGATLVTSVAPALASANLTWTCTGSCQAGSGTGHINATLNLAAGTSATYTLQAVVPATITGSLAMQATATAPAGVGDVTENNTATDTDAQAVPPQIQSFQVQHCVRSGSNRIITWQWTMENWPAVTAFKVNSDSTSSSNVGPYATTVTNTTSYINPNTGKTHYTKTGYITVNKNLMWSNFTISAYAGTTKITGTTSSGLNGTSIICP